MAVAALKLDEHYLNHLTPLNSLAPELLEEVLANSEVERLPPGRRIFSQRDADNRTIFLLSGQLVLVADGQAAVTLRADSREASQPIAAGKPRQVTALAGSSVTILTIDSTVLSRVMDKSRGVASQEGVSVADRDDCRQVLSNHPLFSNLPEPHQQVLLRRMVEIQAWKDQPVVQEGAPGDYYYIVLSGSCCVSTTKRDTAFEHILTPGCGFGESALIENGVYQITVTMAEDGSLLRLSKGEFMTLMVKPFVKTLDRETARERIDQGSILLDIRTPSAFKRAHIPGSINLPLMFLHKLVEILDNNRSYIICGHHGRRAMLAAFLLAETGVQAAVLDIGAEKLLSN